MAEEEHLKKQGNRNSHEFTFPSILSQGFQFNSVNQIKEYLNKEAARGVDPTRNTLFLFRPSKDKNNSLRLKCRHCTCFINLIQEGGRLIVKSFNIEHRHQLETTRTKLQDQLFKQLRHQYKKEKNNKKQRRAKKEQIAFNISEQQLVHLVNKFQYQELHSFNYLEAMLKKNKCEIALDWGSNADKVGYPYVIVTASPMMLKNFERYGDLMCFDVLYHILKNDSNGKRFKVGMFSVIDTNLRILIAGVAILCQEVAHNLQKVFEMFFQIHKSKPKTIITDQQSGVCNAIQQLKQKGIFRGGHLIDSFHYIKKVKTKLKKTPQIAWKVSVTMTTIMQTRNQDQFQTSLASLQALIPGSEVYKDFIDKLGKLTFLEGPRTFVGIRRVSLEKINQQMKKYLSKPTTIAQMAKIVSRLCSILTNRSNKSFQEIPERLDVPVDDIRVKKLKDKIENFVMQRFIQNYVTAKHQYIVKEKIQDKMTDTHMFSLMSKVSGKIFEVLDWECRCGELIRTGIPCPHVLACAIEVPNKDLFEFFNKRWIKEITSNESQGNKVSTMGTKTAGLFKSLETMYI